MPIKKSAMKEMRADARKALRNRQVRGTYRSAIKSFELALSESKLDEAKKFFLLAQKTIDKAISKNVIKKNTGSRKKSRMSKALKLANQNK